MSENRDMNVMALEACQEERNALRATLNKTSGRMIREPSWSLCISKAENGYVLSYWNVLDNNVIRKSYIAVEERPDGNEAECAKRLLWEVLEHFGVYQGITITCDNEKQED
jgi:hypothetical protein